MANPTYTEPVTDSVPKVNNEIAVGEDLKFQYRWWRFERIVWILFTVILILDVTGCFGKGPAADARVRTQDGSMDVQYERIERFGTPSIMTVKFGPSAARDGKIRIWASDSLVKELGNQRIMPQPSASDLDGHGLLYTFPVQNQPDSIEFALEPAKPGFCDLTLRVIGSEELNFRIFVVP